jgi:hypothetical protein
MAEERQAVAFHPSWPAGARGVVERAIERHGGWSLWARLEGVTIELASLGGVLPRLKGYRRSFQLPPVLTALPKLGRTDWFASAGGARVGVFERGAVRLLDPASGAVTFDSPDHRRALLARRGRALRRWRLQDALYFFGYAFASYSAVPFILPGLRWLGPVTASRRGQRLEGVAVEFPAGAQVHSRRQRYLFDAGGLLRRNDYVADVVAPWATGAHHWDDFVTVDGLPLPSRRTVLWRLGGRVLPYPAVLAATFRGFSVSART